MKDLESIVLVGGGGHCKACIDVLEQEGKFKIAGIVDLPEKVGDKVLGYDIFGTDADLPEIAKKYDNFLITIGHITTPEKRIEIFDLLTKLNVNLPVIISPLAYVSKHALIGDGSIIMHQAIVNAGANTGKNCIINTKALVEHDAQIGNYCHIATGAILNGDVILGSSSFYGSGAISKQGVEIPEFSFIKANSIVK